MEREFNVTGSCVRNKHYMVDITNKFNQVMKLIKKGKYFTINRPRQFGKTTMLNTLFANLRKNDFIVAYMSFEGIGEVMFRNEENFAENFIDLMTTNLGYFDPVAAKELSQYKDNCKNLKTLSASLKLFLADTKKKVIVLIDEVDKTSDNQIFLSFLGMLREDYLAHDKFGSAAFQSVILTGVHDVKSLKLKIRKGDEVKLNSPWNIAADFNVDMSFNPAEIKTMLVDYAEQNGVKMDYDTIAERIHYYTSGYPFLVSKICKNIDEEEADQNTDYDPKHWKLTDIDWSFKWLTREDYTTTNFDDLVKNLENNPILYELVFSIVMSTQPERIMFSQKDPVVNLAVLYGILKNDNGTAAVHNRIYEQIIADYMRMRIITRGHPYRFNGFSKKYLDDKGNLNIKKTMMKFQEFMREHYSNKDSKFLEREGRLIFMSFLKPIINGNGFMWKESVVADERRMDIVITFGKEQKEVIELKIWRGKSYHEKGLQQLSDYLDFQGIKNGYLLIYDFSKNKEYKSEQIQFKDKSIFAVWI